MAVLGSRSPLGRRFLTVWAGQTVSSVGTALSSVGVAVHIYLVTGDAVWLGVLTAAISVPYVLAGPLHPIVDRFPRRTVMLGADVFAAIGPATALLFALAGQLRPVHLVAAALLGGLGNALQVPAYQAAVPALVQRSELDRANGLAQLGDAAGSVAGPLLAAPIVAWFGIEAILAVDLATFLVGAVATGLVPFTDQTDPAGRTGPDRAPAGGGAAPAIDDGSWAASFRWLRGGGRSVAVLLGSMALVNLVLSGYSVGITALSTEVAGPARAGLVLASGGGAMVVGSLLVGRYGIGADRIGNFSAGLGAVALGSVVAASRPWMPLLMVGTAASLLLVPLVNASLSTVFQERVPESMQGRVFGLRVTIGRALSPLGALAAGVLISDVAGPLIDHDGALAGTLGLVMGTGRERAPAVLLVAGAVLLGALAGGLWRSSLRTELRQEPVPSGPGADAVPGPMVAVPDQSG